ncbi:MAG: flavin reductase family protein [Proteobacteria bacterium]|nr:flavin reductase family protein [Pseudomonadota bacterium]
MLFDLETLPPDLAYKILGSTVTPRPIAWVTTLSETGISNAAPYSFFNVMGDDPPLLVLGVMRDGRKGFKDTAANILATGEFVVNLVPERLAQQMNITSIDAPAEVNELDLAGLATAPSTKVKPPRIAQSPVAFECKLMTSLITGPKQAIVLGRVVAAHLDEAIVLDKARCHIDTPALGLIARMHGSGVYLRSSDMFEMTRPRWADWQGKATKPGA